MKSIPIAILLLGLAAGSAFSQWVSTNGPYGGSYNIVTGNSSYLFAVTDKGLARSRVTESTWEILPSAPTENVPFMSVCGELIFLEEGNRHYYSTDNGDSWTAIEAFQDSYGKFVLSDSVVLYAGESGVVRQSLDNGKSWSQLQIVGNRLVDISAFKNKVLITSQYKTYFSTDNGRTFNLLNSPTIKNIRVLKCYATDSFLIVINDSGLCISSDDGVSWSVNKKIRDYNASDLLIANNSFYISSDFLIYKSIDKGQHWGSLITLPVWPISMQYIQGALYISTERHGIFSTPDDGKTWLSRSDSTFGYQSIQGLYIFNDILLAPTSGQGVWQFDKTQHWLPIALGDYGGSFASELFHYDSVLIAVLDGSTYESLDSGKKWSGPSALFAPYRIRSIGNDLILAQPDTFRNGARIVISYDHGVSWVPPPENIPDAENRDILFVRAVDSSLFMSTTSLGLFRSTDKGMHWAELGRGVFAYGFESDSIRSLVAKGSDLYVCCAKGIFRSSDNGDSWTLANVYEGFMSLATDGATLFAGTQLGVVISTDNGVHWESANIPREGQWNVVVYGDQLYAFSPIGVWHRPINELGVKELRPSDSFALQSYPNPFINTTTLHYELQQPALVSLEVYSLLGEKLGTLESGTMAAGSHEITWNATSFSKGIYVCVLTVSGEKKIILLVNQ